MKPIGLCIDRYRMEDWVSILYPDGKTGYGLRLIGYHLDLEVLQVSEKRFDSNVQEFLLPWEFLT